MTKYHVMPSERDEARKLTNDIKKAADNLWELLLEAWNRKAHVSLGYKTWTAYVDAEFDFNRRHSYRLINQGQVIKQLREAVSQGTQPEGVSVSEREARDIAPHMPEVIEQVSAGVPVRVAVERVRGSVTSARFDDGYSFEDDAPVREVECQHDYVCAYCGEHLT